MSAHIRALLFDLDGVVVFTDRYHYLGWKKLADEEGWAFDEEVNKGCRGVPRMASLEVILKHNQLTTCSAEEKEVFADRKNRYYKELLNELGPDDLYPGVLAFLEGAKATGARLALCSSSRNARQVLATLNLERFFEVVVTGDEVTNAKPAPDIFLSAAERMGIPPFHCLVLEDAYSGVEAALAAKMKVLGVGDATDLPNAPECFTDYTTIDLEALLETGRPSRPPVEAWSLTEKAFKPRRQGHWETLFAQSNGLIGWRGTLEEPSAGQYGTPGLIMNGVYGFQKYNWVERFSGYADGLEALVNLADFRLVELEVNGQPFGFEVGKMTHHERTLDLRRGWLTREAAWTAPDGVRIEVKTERFVSMWRRHSFAMRYEVRFLDPCEVTLRSLVHVDMPSLNLPGKQVELTANRAAKGLRVLELKTTTGPHQVALGCAHRVKHGLDDAGSSERAEADGITYVLEADAMAGSSLTLDKFGTLYSTLETSAPELAEKAALAVGKDAEDGYDALRAEQVAFWREFWDQSGIDIEGHEGDQQALRLSLFHLRQSHPEDPLRSIGANSMTGEKYRGHVFWDTEMYLAPFFLYTNPELVRPLLEYRYSILDAARQRAREMNGKGALYSWNSISGRECCVVFEAATAEYHLLPAIAHCIYRYVRGTGDVVFLQEKGLEILIETARFMVDRGAYVPEKGFCINAVCGPDEYGCGVNNNAYTNAMSQWHLRYAAKSVAWMQDKDSRQWEELARKLAFDPSETEAWLKAAEAMYIPFDETRGIHAQDDSFLYLDPVDMSRIPKYTDLRELYHPLNLWRMQVLKQADVVLLMFVLGEQFSPEVKEANYAYYEPRTNHGSSLSPSIHAILAAETGRHAEAYQYCRESAYMDINDFKNNTNGGVHSACLGGTWMAVVFGLAGMRDGEGGLSFRPHLPAAWRRLRIPLVWRGRRLELILKRDSSTFRLHHGETCTFRVNETDVTLSPEASEVTIDYPVPETSIENGRKEGIVLE